MIRTEVSGTVNGLQLKLVSAQQVVLSGRLTVGNTGSDVAAELDALHRHVVKESLDEFSIDVLRLEFVNSSAIRFFVDWVAKAERAGYRLRFQMDPRVTWQRLSFSVLKSLAPKTVEIAESSAPEPIEQR